MSYYNEFLQDFRSVYFSILKAKQILPERVEIEVIDEESDEHSVFEPADVKDVLEQLSCDLNFLAIYTERPAYFAGFAETMYEENGLIVMIFSKKCFRRGRHRSDTHQSAGNFAGGAEYGAGTRLVLDFEWEGKCYDGQIAPGSYYIPIHKKPWEIAENLDITVPIGYNTVIVKSTQNKQKKPGRDRFEEAFYHS